MEAETHYKATAVRKERQQKAYTKARVVELVRNGWLGDLKVCGRPEQLIGWF